MALLPAGFALPPLPYLVALLGAAAVVGIGLYFLEPDVPQRMALALAPWMAAGGALHALSLLELTTPLVRPLLGAPAVYVTTFVAAGAVWLFALQWAVALGYPERVPTAVGLTGTAVLTAAVAVAVLAAVRAGTFAPVWPAVAIIVAGVITVALAFALALWRTPTILRLRYLLPVVLYAHALDGVSTAIGADVLDTTERSPIPRAIMEFAAGLPTADALGVGWLFILVKLAVASAIVVGLRDYVEERTGEATLVLSGVAAVGLGPATNNLVIFLAGAG